MEKFNTLMIEPDTANRNRLKTACLSVIMFGEFHHSKDIEGALDKLSGTDPIEVVFITSNYRLEQIGEFIASAKGTTHREGAAYIALTAGGSPDELDAAKGAVLGIDAQLTQPYSVDSLSFITALAARVQRMHQRRKVAKAIRKMISEVVRQLEITSFFLAHKDSQRTSHYQKEFRNSAKVLRSLNPEQREIYFELLVELLEKAQPPPELPEKLNYRGQSQRIRRLLEGKIVERLRSIIDE